MASTGQQVARVLRDWLQMKERTFDDKYWCRFELDGESVTGLTAAWQVYGKNGSPLGEVRWRAASRKYAFWPGKPGPLTDEYIWILPREMFEIAGFAAEATRAHYAIREAGRSE